MEKIGIRRYILRIESDMGFIGLETLVKFYGDVVYTDILKLASTVSPRRRH